MILTATEWSFARGFSLPDHVFIKQNEPSSHRPYQGQTLQIEQKIIPGTPKEKTRALTHEGFGKKKCKRNHQEGRSAKILKHCVL
jgi:hypothetical protein